jgi:hypothetical protein
MSEPRFSAEHRAQFEKLLKIGEVYAINLQPESWPFGPWAAECDLPDKDKADRLKSRFCLAVRKVAIAAGAPPRANLLDWWISRLAKNENRLGMDCLIQRSIELCEEFEEDSAELPWKMQLSAMAGLRRDQYPTNFEMPYWLYDVPHDTLPDSKAEFEYWRDHVWECFRKWLQALEKNEVRRIDGSTYTHDLPKRQSGETRPAFRNRIEARVSTRYERLKSALQCLSFDLAVLLANYVIDRGLTGADAMGAFGADSVPLMEEMHACWKDSSRRLGLSWRKQLKEGKEAIDFRKAFDQVAADLKLLVTTAGNFAALNLQLATIADVHANEKQSEAPGLATHLTDTSPSSTGTAEGLISFRIDGASSRPT